MGEHFHKRKFLHIIYLKKDLYLEYIKNSYNSIIKRQILEQVKDLGFPGGTVVKNPPANAGHMGSSPGLGRSHMPQSN